MSNFKAISEKIKDSLGLHYFPIGMCFSDTYPQDSINSDKKFNGCIIPLIFSSAKGKTIAFNKNNAGRDCSTFFLGYKDWIFPGIECFLSDGIIFDRGGERFVKTPKQAKAFIKSFVPKEINKKVTVFKPLQNFINKEYPELVIFFVNPDELSGLVYLLHFNSPDKDDLIITGFHSGCGSIVTLPMKYNTAGKIKAVIGMHDISVRSKLPKDIMTLTMPFELVSDIYNEIDNSFIITENWDRIKERNLKDQIVNEYI
jgi:uncharacterized protein (DUF169 family)